MKQNVKFRVVVADPLPGVKMQVQKGKSDLLPPNTRSGELIFDFDIKVDLSGTSPNFLSEYAQGPKNSRFVYLNSGSYAGQAGTVWSRRAKLSLMTITKDQIDIVLKGGGSRIETNVPGVGGDGGPICASVKPLEWKVVKE